jgi:hypothetical protein
MVAESGRTLVRRTDHQKTARHHTSVRQLNNDIRAWIATWNKDTRPYIWTKTADQILDSIGNSCRRINDSGH